MAAFDTEEIETVLDENETLPASPISHKHINSNSPKVVVKKGKVLQQFRP